MSESGNPTESLLNIGNFIILLVSGAIIPLLLVLYKSRCKRICWGCITRDVLDADPDEPDKKKEKRSEPMYSREAQNTSARSISYDTYLLHRLVGRLIAPRRRLLR